MSPRFVLGRENVPCVAEAVNRSLKADCTDFNLSLSKIIGGGGGGGGGTPHRRILLFCKIVKTITLKIADQRWSDIYVVFAKIVCGRNFYVW